MIEIERKWKTYNMTTKREWTKRWNKNNNYSNDNKMNYNIWMTMSKCGMQWWPKNEQLYGGRGRKMTRSLSCSLFMCYCVCCRRCDCLVVSIVIVTTIVCVCTDGIIDWYRRVLLLSLLPSNLLVAVFQDWCYCWLISTLAFLLLWYGAAWMCLWLWLWLQLWLYILPKGINVVWYCCLISLFLIGNIYYKKGKRETNGTTTHQQKYRQLNVVFITPMEGIIVFSRTGWYNYGLTVTS